jgi:hypothetical protein
VIAVLFDAGSWERPEIPYAMDVLCQLLEVPFEPLPPGSRPGPDRPLVFVGDPALAPADAAAVVAVGAWSPWQPSRVRVATFEGSPVLEGPEADSSVRDERELPLAWLRTAAFLLLREEERHEPHRDEWGCFSGFASRLHELNLLDRPVLNAMADQLAKRVEAWRQRRGVSLERIPRWKDGAPFAVALTHDVDWTRRFSLVEAARLVAQAKGPGSYALRHGLSMAFASLVRPPGAIDPYWNFDRWTTEESGHGFRSAFYFFSERLDQRHAYDATYRYGDPMQFEGMRTTVGTMMRRLVESGFEVGLHGSYLSHENAEALTLQRRRLESALRHPVVGLRQHFLRFDVRSTWKAQERAGFRYDTTLGYNECVGFRAGLAAPFHPFDPEARRPHTLLELPLTAMDGVLFRTLKLDSTLASRRLVGHLETVESAGGLAVLLWHPNAADASSCAGWWETYQAGLDHLRHRGAWVTSPREITEWWLQRESRMRRGS